MAHELTHVLQQMEEPARKAELDRKRVRFASDAPKIKALFEAFKANGLTKEMVFGNPSTAEAHARHSAADFYAESYSVFHGPHQLQQARLLEQAPDLYDLFEVQAKKAGTPVPDRAALERLIREGFYRR